jgi:NAD(P)-dependent dehydrogenase (short-subunit alcohol dehydrogenase family)
MGSLDGQVGIVTGAATGLGRHYAMALAQQGCSLALCDVRDEVLETARMVRSLGVKSIAEVADVSIPADVRRVVDGTANAFGRIDVLINNAAVMRTSTASDDLDKSIDDYDALVRVNLKGPFMFGRAVIPHMIRRHSGNIINIATDHVHTHPGRPTGGREARMDIYDATKWGLLGLTVAWAKELKAHNIRVNSFSMGATDTPMVRAFFGSPTPEQIATWIKPDELCTLAVRLLEEGPDGRTGENIGSWIGFDVALQPIPSPQRAAAPGGGPWAA